MPTFNATVVPTALGRIALTSQSGRSGRARILFIPGMLQTIRDLLHWSELIDSDIEPIFTELPGHGASPSEGDCTVAGLAERLRLAIRGLSDRPIVVIGASLGGLIALALADGRVPQVRGVIAGDPPLTMTKQWSIRDAMALYSSQLSPFVREFADLVFGDAVYYDLIGQVAVPSLIITGDVPLWPRRALAGVNLMDDDDLDMIRRIGNPLVAVRRIPDCGHLVLARGAPSEQLVREFCQQRLPVPGIEASVGARDAAVFGFGPPKQSPA
jgi:pimeloyl-ACP methyl ester carboxylesterase